MAKKKVDEAVAVASVQLPRVHEPTPNSLLQLAIEKGTDISHIEKLMDLKERWDKEQSRKSYLLALAKFQSICPELKKNKKVSYEHRDGSGKTEYFYQELADVIKHTKAPLSECGLSYQWEQSEEGDNISVTCILNHVDGHVQVGKPLSGKADDSGKKNNIQKKASTITYLKRYTLLGMLGIASADMDDDGMGGAKASKGVDLIKMTSAHFTKGIKLLMTGETTMEYIQSTYVMTEDQKAALIKAENEYKEKTK